MMGAMKTPSCVTTSQTWFRSRYRMKSTLAASENPATIRKKSAWYTVNRTTPAGVGGRRVAFRNVTRTRENSASVITAFDADVTTTIHDGNRALVRRYPLARID